MPYITDKERTALLDASDFIGTNADGADDPEPYEEMQRHLMSLFRKAKAEKENQAKRKLVKKYLKTLTK